MYKTIQRLRRGSGRGSSGSRDAPGAYPSRTAGIPQLFNDQQFRAYARRLAAAHPVVAGPAADDLTRRLHDYEDALDRAFQESMRSDVFLSIGTSAVVEPAASLPRIAKSAGAFLVEVNPAETALSTMADAVLRGKAGELLPKLAESGPF